jgi:hypothetical protein
LGSRPDTDSGLDMLEDYFDDFGMTDSSLLRILEAKNAMIYIDPTPSAKNQRKTSIYDIQFSTSCSKVKCSCQAYKKSKKELKKVSLADILSCTPAEEIPSL